MVQDWSRRGGPPVARLALWKPVATATDARSTRSSRIRSTRIHSQRGLHTVSPFLRPRIPFTEQSFPPRLEREAADERAPQFEPAQIGTTATSVPQNASLLDDTSTFVTTSGEWTGPGAPQDRIGITQPRFRHPQWVVL